MRHLAAKLAFVHRTLWRRDAAYRWAVLLGPPPLLGCTVAALALAVVPLVAADAPTPGAAVPWAQWTRPVVEEGQPFTEPPSRPLPQKDAAGHYAGFQPGWVGVTRPLTVDATADANVGEAVLTNFTLQQTAIPLDRIRDAGPPTGLFVGGAQAFFVVPAPGIYAFSARLTRSGTQSADCLVRLGSTKHRILRYHNINTDSLAVLNYPPTEFRLEPGLFLLGVAAGCWRGDRVSGDGELAIMVRHPGDTALRPAAEDELIRPVPR